MVQNRSKDAHANSNAKGFLFDDTPRGLLEALLIGGGMVAALTFAPTAIAALAGIGYLVKAEDRARRKRLNNSIAYAQRNKYVRIHKAKKGVAFELTKRGWRVATRVRLKKSLLKPVERPKKWDGLWRIILFDIATEDRTKRNGFRGLIQRLGAVMLQKSVWIYPFDCTEQVNMLKEFFELSDKELRVVIAVSIGGDAQFRHGYS